MYTSNHVTHFALANHRNKNQRFGIKQADRLSHMYIIGKTGTGKTTLLENLIMSDIKAGLGCCLIDPHGDLVRQVVKVIPEYRKNDVIYLDATDLNQPFGYNPLRYVVEEKRRLVASGILEIFKKMWSDSWGSKMEQVLRYALFGLLDYPYATLADITRLLHDDEFRKKVCQYITNPEAKEYWTKKYPSFSPSVKDQITTPIDNKVGALLLDPNLYRILIKPEKELRFRQVMDESKILLVNVSKGQVGADSSGLLGALLTTAIGSAAFSRADMPIENRKPFFIYLDEFQTFTTSAIAEMLSELRKYKMGMVLAHQFLHQLKEDIRHSVLGNVGTVIAFRLGAQDASFMAREFQPKFDDESLMKVPNYEIRLKLMIDNNPSQPFSAKTLPPHAYKAI